MDEWRKLLSDARRRVKLSRRELAELAQVAAATIKAYELGPSGGKRRYLLAILDALRLEHVERRRILTLAGFAADDRASSADYASVSYSPDDAVEEAERHLWPAFVTDEFARVVGANRVAQRLWGVDLRYEYTDPVERNLLSVANDQRFADRCLNWEEAVGVILAVFKAHDWAPEQLEQPGPYFAAVMERFLSGDPRRVARFLEVWKRTPSEWGRQIRWSYRIVWDQPSVGILRFDCLVSLASDADGLAFNDWIPTDSATWHGLEMLAQVDE
ncbi:MAG: hypothetical protein M1337_03165 [Actinobacteria bacterium]|nr:hypothetical protein [Actinomycetota bacterium]